VGRACSGAFLVNCSDNAFEIHILEEMPKCCRREKKLNVADTLERTLLEVAGRNFRKIFRPSKHFDNLEKSLKKRFEIVTMEQR